MTGPVDALVYITYLGSRWRFIGLSCAAALVIATVMSIAERREYTATARVLIEPPAGADPRAAMEVSPVYLESLKTFEQLAASDSLFQKAGGRFQLQSLTGVKAIESLKKRVLRVGLVRNTRILEIAATLPDDTEWAGVATREPVEGLRDAIEEATNLRAKLREQAGSARLEIADTAERAAHSSASEAELLRREQDNAEARLSEIQKQIAGYDRQIADEEQLLAQRQARRDDLDARRAADQKALAAVESRLRDTRNDIGYRGERLSVIDPGVVPERPSAPNIQLNLLAALLLGLLFPLIYLAIALNLEWQRASAGRDVIEALARARDG